MIAFSVLFQYSFAREVPVDSLKQLLRSNMSDTTRIDLLLELASEEKHEIIKKDYFDQALYLAVSIDHQKGIYKALEKKALYFNATYETDSAILLLKKYLSYWANSNKYLIKTYYRLSDLYSNISSNDSAAKYIHKGLDLATTNGWNYEIARGYMILGNRELYKLEYEKAFKLYAYGDSICDTDLSLKVSSLKAKFLNYLGYAVKNTHGFEKAVEYYFQAREMYRQLEDNKGIQEVNIGLSQYYTDIEDYPEAEKLLSEAIEYHRVNGPESSFTYALICRGYLYLTREMFVEAERDHLLYYELAFKTKHKALQLNALTYNSLLYLKMKNFPLAREYAKRGVELSKEMGESEARKTIYEYLIEAYTGTNETTKLNETYKEYLDLRDDIERSGKDQEIYDLEKKYQTEKKQQEIELLKTQNNLTRQGKHAQLYLMSGIVFLALVVSLFFYLLFRDRQKTALRLKQLDSSKSRFFANISHEFRTPLTLIKAPITDKLERQDLSDMERNELQIIERNTAHLLELVDQLLDFSKLEAGSMQLQVSRMSILLEIRAISTPFEYLAKQKQINYIVNIPPENDASWFDKNIVEKIVVNLLSNAFKYTPEHGRISVGVSLEQGQCTIRVKNTGKGISNDNIDRIFERFYQIDSLHEGVGIGLSLVHELVLLHQGIIKVNSTIDEYTEFIVDIPVGYKSFEKTVLSPSINTSPNHYSGNTKLINNPVLQHNGKGEEEKLTLLLIEDNQDVRTLIKRYFTPTFSVLEAVDGEEGIKQAFAVIPDIIISDIMMPVKDGISVVSAIKSDERTSHIPIVLLTAKAGVENTLCGLETGADDYITKPFNLKLLKARAQNLIDQRLQLQRKFRQKLPFPIKTPIVPSPDDLFLERVQKLLDVKLTDPSFSPENFSYEIGISRMQLHRKLKALVGLTTTEFIRSQRLKMATILLMRNDISISEVCYSVGFNDLSYFSKCFKEVYACTPSQYVRNKNGNSTNAH